jgi:hypothetical protein
MKLFWFFQGLTKQAKQFFAELQTLTNVSSNYGNLRSKMKERFRPREVPMIPCLRMSLFFIIHLILSLFFFSFSLPLSLKRESPNKE